MANASTLGQQQQWQQRIKTLPHITCTAEILDVDNLDVALLGTCIQRISLCNPVLRAVVTIDSSGKLRRHLTNSLSLQVSTNVCERDDISFTAAGNNEDDVDSRKHCVAAKLYTNENERRFLELSASRLICDESYLEDCMDKVIVLYDSNNSIVFDTARSVDIGEEITCEPCNDEYWTKVIDSADVKISLVCEGSKVPSKNSHRDKFAFNFDEESLNKLDKCCQHLNTHPSMAFLALFETLLYRYSDQNHFCIISSLRGTSSELGVCQPLLETCLNCNVSEQETFVQLLQDLKASIAQALQHGDYLLSETASKDTLGFLQHLPHFYYRKSPIVTALGDKNVISNSYIIRRDPHGTSLVLKITETNVQYSCMIEYNADTIKKTTISRMVGHLHKLLQGVVNYTESKLSTLPLLMPMEIEELKRWNNTDIPINVEYSRIEHAFKAVVENEPGAVAVYCNQDTITYECLNRYASYLSEFLSSQIHDAGIVAVCMKKSIELVVSLLAVLKAGHTYLLIDPTYPHDRIHSILNEAIPSMVIVDKDSKSCIPNQFNALQYSNKLVTKTKPKSQSSPSNQLHPESVAYVLYTSGTSGTPKGVVVEHSAILALMHALQTILLPADIQGVLISSSVSFTLFSGQLFLALLTGNKGILVPSLLHVPNIPSKHEITLMSTPPSSLMPILTDKDLPSGVRCIMLGGDYISREVIELVQGLRRSSPIKLISTHGCSENVLFDAFCVVDNSGEDVSVGKPMPNHKLYIVDNLLQLVPIGVTGELCVSGCQLARGYFKNPALTSERFMQNPFENTSNPKYHRLYRTGDLACRRDNGNIDIMGRMDFQVKINGIRVELEEISGSLMKYPSVEKAVVVLHKSMIVQQQKICLIKRHILVAYYTSGNNSPPTVKDLNQFLASVLPVYMIPTHFIHMDNIPLNRNGKIDRASLPLPVLDSPDECDSIAVLPRTDTEHRIYRLACDLLRRECVGITENIFEHGTDSILAVQFVVKILQQFKTELQVKDIFQQPTIAGLSKLVECSLIGTVMVDVFEPSVDSMLPADISPVATDISPSIKNPKTIFLTGATGFIGAFLLAELLNNSEAMVHCLVRSDNASLGLIRIQSNLIKYDIWERKFETRMKVSVGNFSCPNLGLASDEYDWLAGNVDAIYHCAAPVNFILSYAAVRQETVEGTNEMLRLACFKKVKAFYFVSSIAVHGLKDVCTSELKFENENLDHTESQLPDIGYAKMKWVSEKLVRSAAQRGLPVIILRPSFVIGHSITGAVSTSEYISRLIKGCIQLGSFPDLRAPLWLVPVDYVVKAILQITTKTDNFGGIFHLTPDPQMDVSCSDVMTWVHECGYILQKKSFSEWYKDFKESIEENHDNALYPLLQFVKHQLDTQNSLSEKKILVGFDSTNTCRALEGTGVSFQAVDWKVINKMVLYLIKEGFLSALSDISMQSTPLKKSKTC